MSRRRTLATTCAAVSILIAAGLLSFKEPLIWNRTESAPVGLYWRSDGPLTPGGWAVVSAEAPGSVWAASRGYVGADWPIIKQVRGMSGDEICRTGETVSINGMTVARTQETDSRGRSLPVWQGCFTLQTDEVFLLNDHPGSLDGRYFGATPVRDIAGPATLLWSQR